MQFSNRVFTICDNVLHSLTAYLPFSLEVNASWLGHETYGTLDSRPENCLGRSRPRRKGRCPTLTGKMTLPQRFWNKGNGQTWQGCSRKADLLYKSGFEVWLVLPAARTAMGAAL